MTNLVMIVVARVATMTMDRTTVSTAVVAREPLAAGVRVQILIEVLTAVMVTDTIEVHPLARMTGCRLSETENQLMWARAAKRVMVTDTIEVHPLARMTGCRLSE